MDDIQKPTEPIKDPLESGLPDPLSTPELPPQTMTDEELDKTLPIVKEEERNEDSSSE